MYILIIQSPKLKKKKKCEPFYSINFKVALMIRWNLLFFSCSVMFDSLWPHGLQQASLFFIISQSLLKPMSTELVMPSNHLILCRPLLLLSSIFPSIKVFSSEPAVRVRWPKYWSFSFSISLYNEYPGLISFMSWSPWGLISMLKFEYF